MKRTLLGISVLAITLMVLAACAPAAAPTQAPAEPEAPVEAGEVAELSSVKLGGLLPLTGPLSEFGQNFRNAGQLAIKHLEAAGFPTEVVFTDTEGSPQSGVEAARTLVDVEQVQALIGAASSGVTIPVAQSVSVPNQVPQISNASTSPLISVLPADEGKDFLFRTVPSDALQGVALAMLAADEGYEKVSVLYVNNAYGEGLAAQFKASFEKRGGSVSQMTPHDEQPAPTYTAEIKQVMEGDPGAMVALGYPGHATVYLKEFIEAGYSETTDLLFVDGTKSQKIPTEIGPEYFAGYMGTAPAASEEASPEVFGEEYAAEYGSTPPLPFMDSLYDAIVVARLAAAAAEAKGMEVTPVNIRDMLREVANEPGEKIGPGADSLAKAFDLLMEGEAIDYDGAVGVAFDDKGDMVSPIEVWKYIEEDPFIERVRLETDIPAE